MNKKDNTYIIRNLETQLKEAPTNIPLKLRLAKAYFQESIIDKSEQLYQEVIKQESTNIRAKHGLAEIYFTKKNYSAVIIIAEEMSNKKQASDALTVLQIKALLRQNNHKEAEAIYRKLTERNPFIFDDELMDVFEEGIFSEDFDDSGFSDEYEDFDEFEDEFMDHDFEHIDDYLGQPALDQLAMGMNLIREFLVVDYFDYENLVGYEEITSDLINKCFHLFNENDNWRSKYQIPNFYSTIIFGAPGIGKNQIARTVIDTWSEAYIQLEDLPPSPGQSPYDDRSNTMRLGFTYWQGDEELKFMLINDIERFCPYSAANMEPTTSLFRSIFVDPKFDLNGKGMLGITDCPWLVDERLLQYGKIDELTYIPPPSDEAKLKYIGNYYSKAIPLRRLKKAILEHTKDFTFTEIQALAEHIAFFRHKQQRAIKANEIQQITDRMTPAYPIWKEELKQKLKGRPYLKSLLEKAMNTNLD